MAQERLRYDKTPRLGTDGETESEWYPVASDPNGAPHTLYTSNGKALWRAKRSLWGEIKRKDEQADREALARIVPDTLLARQLKQYDDGPECDLRFAGQWEDEESGLHYNLHRYYDPKTGQYLSSDPIGLNGGLRTHAYVHDPVQWIDPAGLAGCGETKVYIPEGKFNYIFGKVKSSLHNASRSTQLKTVMKRIGIYDDTAGHEILTDYLSQAVKSEGNVVDAFSNNYGDFETRKSLLFGPGGATKIQSIFQVLSDGSRNFTTMISFEGGGNFMKFPSKLDFLCEFGLDPVEERESDIYFKYSHKSCDGECKIDFSFNGIEKSFQVVMWCKGNEILEICSENVSDISMWSHNDRSGIKIVFEIKEVSSEALIMLYPYPHCYWWSIRT